MTNTTPKEFITMSLPATEPYSPAHLVDSDVVIGKLLDAVAAEVRDTLRKLYVGAGAPGGHRQIRRVVRGLLGVHPTARIVTVDLNYRHTGPGSFRPEMFDHAYALVQATLVEQVGLDTRGAVRLGAFEVCHALPGGLVTGSIEIEELAL